MDKKQIKMMKIMSKRKILVFMLVVVLVCGIVVMLGGCENNGTEEGEISFTQGLEYKLNLDDTYSVVGIGVATAVDEIVIPNKYEGKTVASVGEKAFYNCTKIKSVTLPNSITKIQANAFALCDNLKKISLPENLTEIGDNAFYKCVAIENLTFEEKLEIIGENAFFSCSSLKNLDFPKSVKQFGSNALEGCSSLTNLTLPFLGSSREDISTATLSYLFGNTNSDVRNINKLTAPNEDNQKSVPNSLKKVVLISGNIGEKAFYQCESIENVTISDSTYEIGNYAFYGCVNLEAIVIPNSVKTIGNNAFEGCVKLKSIDIPSSVSKIGSYAFKNCIGIQSLTLAEGVSEIGEFAFEQCSSLAEILIPDSVFSIGISAFSSCSNLKKVVIGKGLTTIENGVFNGAIALESLEIGANVAKIGLNAFNGCSSLKILSLPASVNEIANMAFMNCTSLIEIKVDEKNSTFKGEGNCLIKGNVFILGCKTSVIPNGVVRIKENAFKNCEGLISINIPSSVEEVSSQAFVGCNQLQSFVVDSKNTKYRAESNYLIEIDSVYGDILLLAGNSEETFRRIPNTIAIIGENSFQNCGSLTNITLPSSIREIKNNAFANCNSLTDIVFEGSKEEWISINKDNWCNFENSITISCIDGKLDQFENELE